MPLFILFSVLLGLLQYKLWRWLHKRWPAVATAYAVVVVLTTAWSLSQLPQMLAQLRKINVK